MIDVPGGENSALGNLESWEKDYPNLVELRDSFSYEDALEGFVSMTPISAVIGTDDTGKILDGTIPQLNEIFEKIIRNCRDADSISRVIGERTDLYNRKFSRLMAPEFRDSVHSGDLFSDISHDFYHVDFQQLITAFPGKVKTALSLPWNVTPDDPFLYFYSLLYILTADRDQGFSVPFAEHDPENSISEGQRSWLRSIIQSPADHINPPNPQFNGPGSKVFQEAVILNATSLASYRQGRETSNKSYHAEEMFKQNPADLEKYALCLLRLVLGKSPDFSDSLQEDMICSIVKDLGERYYFCGKEAKNPFITNVIRELRDLRARRFEHENIFSGSRASSGIISPIGAYIDPSKPGHFMDLGCGEMARGPNAVHRAFPNWVGHGVDVNIPANYMVTEGVNLHHHDLGNDYDFDRMLYHFNRGIDVALASNIFHKLPDPAQFLRMCISELVKRGTGLLYVVHPIYSSYHIRGGEQNYKTGAGYLRAIMDQDTTQFPSSLWSMEIFMEFLLAMRKVSFPVEILSLGLSPHSENDTSRRVHAVLRMVK